MTKVLVQVRGPVSKVRETVDPGWIWDRSRGRSGVGGSRGSEVTGVKTKKDFCGGRKGRGTETCIKTKSNSSSKREDGDPGRMNKKSRVECPVIGATDKGVTGTGVGSGQG